jgi:hypothetical protein
MSEANATVRFIAIRPFIFLGYLLLAAGTGFGQSPSTQPIPSATLRITVSDGSVLNAQLRTAAIHFQTSMGTMSINVASIASFRDGGLTLADGTILKGKFVEAQLPVQLSTGPIDLPIDKVVAIEALPPGGVAPVVPAPQAGEPQLVGRVFDNFGQPLGSVTVQIDNTQFATTTGADGSYALDYAPGQVTVEYAKSGYRGGSLQFNLAQPSRVPVRDLSLVKEPPGKLCLLSEHDYSPALPAQVHKTSQNLNGNAFGGGATLATIYSVSGDAYQMDSGTIKFMLDHEGLAASVHPEIYRMRPNGVFVRETMTGIGAAFNYTGQKEAVETEPGHGDIRVYSAKLQPGKYVLVTCVNAEDAGVIGSFSGPRYIFGTPAYILNVGSGGQTGANAQGVQGQSNAVGASGVNGAGKLTGTSEKLVGAWLCQHSEGNLLGGTPPKTLEFREDGSVTWGSTTGSFKIASEDNPKVPVLDVQLPTGEHLLDLFIQGDNPTVFMLSDHLQVNFSHYGRQQQKGVESGAAQTSPYQNILQNVDNQASFKDVVRDYNQAQGRMMAAVRFTFGNMGEHIVRFDATNGTFVTDTKHSTLFGGTHVDKYYAWIENPDGQGARLHVKLICYQADGTTLDQGRSDSWINEFLASVDNTLSRMR